MSSIPAVSSSASNFPGKLVMSLIQKSLAGLGGKGLQTPPQIPGKGQHLNIKV